MRTKLTLNLERIIIEKAKEHARLHNTSLSRIVEDYLQKITDGKEEKDKITPLVKSLSGIINLTKDFGQRKDYSYFLVDKYK